MSDSFKTRLTAHFARDDRAFPSEEAYQEQVRAATQQLSGMAEHFLEMFKSEPTVQDTLAQLEKASQAAPPDEKQK